LHTVPDGHDVAVHAHCPFEPQTWPAGHELAVHTQPPLVLHAGVVPLQLHTHVSEAPHVGVVVPVHTEHVSLDAPHAPFPLPPTHVPDVAPGAIEQHPPLHVPWHVVPQTPPMHAWFVGHWLSAVHPQTPVGSPLGKHPGVPPPQLAHAPPFDPHAFGAVPPTHVPVDAPAAISQHPPVHATEAEHVVSQVWEALHATSGAQSVLAVLHPHVPPDPPEPATHALPTLVPLQLWHAPPVSPHAVASVPRTHVPTVPASAE
jgi:hypothetical protein